MAAKKAEISRESDCFSITRRPAAENQLGKLMFTIMRHAVLGRRVFITDMTEHRTPNVGYG